MTEEEDNLDLKAQQREHQQRVEQHLKTIEKSLKSMNTNINISAFIIIALIVVFMNLVLLSS